MSSKTEERSPDLRTHSGLFLVLDGPDGGGKSTQIIRIVEWLSHLGHDVLTCRDPGGTSLGERVRSLLLERSAMPICASAEMLLYMASRAQLVEEVIRPALVAGRVVISDRFTWANVVYQGFAGGLGVEAVKHVGETATGDLRADLTLILDVPNAIARLRIGKGRDRMEDRGLEFDRKVRQGFLNVARQSALYSESRIPVEFDGEAQSELMRDPDWCNALRGNELSKVVMVDASGDPESVFSQIKNEVERVLALGPRT